MEISQEVIDLIVENKNEKDDKILSMLVTSGLVSYSDAKKVFNTVLEEQGLRLSKAQRDEKAEELLETFNPDNETTADEVAEQIELLESELDCSKAIARNYVKAKFDEEDITMPKVTANAGPRGPRTPGFKGDTAITLDFFLKNPNCTQEEFTAHMEEIGKRYTQKGADKSIPWFHFIRDLRIFMKSWKESGNCDIEFTQ